MEHSLHALDDELSRIRSAMRHPEYRRRLLAGLDIPGGVTTIRVLRSVETLSAGNPASIRDVAERLAVEHSTASRAVDTAVRADLLTRESSASDQRKTQLLLTPSGRRVLKRAANQRLEVLSHVTEGWDESQLEELLTLLSRLNADFERLREAW